MHWGKTSLQKSIPERVTWGRNYLQPKLQLEPALELLTNCQAQTQILNTVGLYLC